MRRLLSAFAVLLWLSALSSAPSAQEKPDALKSFNEGRFDEARAICLAEIEANPRNIDSYVVLGWSLIALGRHADAELYLTRAYETVRRDHRVMQSLGEVSYFLGKNEAALSWFRLYVSTVPEGARVAQSYYLMGETYLRLERYEHADIAFAAALHHTPANARWWARLGYARERKSDWTWALAAYDEALRLNPRLQEAIDGKARVAARLRR